jgi:hypothetical protein
LKEREWKRVNGRLLELMSRSKKKEEEERIHLALKDF